MSDDIGDIEADDTFDPDDGDVDWSKVGALQQVMDDIESIDYDDDRLEAAKELAKELG